MMSPPMSTSDETEMVSRSCDAAWTARGRSEVRPLQRGRVEPLAPRGPHADQVDERRGARPRRRRARAATGRRLIVTGRMGTPATRPGSSKLHGDGVRLRRSATTGYAVHA